ncbi:hydroxyethylthiazole kinase [Oleidesulfovibrio sp.]|uniref:hydroxyethylthiazole kinase n=1 Tax=Oleidesulfovibrio sp. TaxID=2909707 RepID=UPI003A87C830
MSEHDFVWDAVQRVRTGGPLVHNITNYVVMNNTANALLAAGASPIMAHAREEVEELAGLVSALVLNIGTLSLPWIEAMFVAGNVAAQRGVPIVVDPVGAGASVLRTETSIKLLAELKPSILRGNASEILAVAGAKGATKGVDSTHKASDAADAARAIATQYGCTVVVSGVEDFVTDGKREALIFGGHDIMPKVTGMGCTASAIVGAHAAVADYPFEGAVAGMAVMAVAGTIAARKAKGPGSFQVNFIDALYGMQPLDVEAGVKVEWK